jgi:bifunctional non-homologous end joining protein LigD
MQKESIGGVQLSHPGRVLYDAQGLTKADLAAYLESVGERMLPHVANRPLALVRCPRGRSNACFFQKHPQGGEPEGIGRVKVPEGGGTGTHFCLRDARGLVAMAQLGVLEIHIWGSRADWPERPDRMVLDLDPAPGVGLDAIRRGAREVRQRLEDDGLRAFVMATGGKGLHVVVPLERRHDFRTVRRYAQGLAKAMEKDDPDRYVAKASKESRHGKVFVDYLRNGLGATAIAPYSMRAKRGAPVATPLSWDELGRLDAPDAYTVQNLRRRLSALSGDPWAGYDDAAGRLPSA